MPLFLCAIEVWGSTLECKHLSRIDKFCKRAHKYSYLLNFTPIKDILRVRDKLLWEQITKDYDHCLRDLLPMQREGRSVIAAITTFYLVFVRNVLSELLLTDVFLVLSRLQLVFS